jgi:hypothetical protein
VRLPYRFTTPESRATSSPERWGGWNSKSTVFRTRGGSTFSILSSFFTRDCTCAACEARALKRSMKACSFLSIACWRSKAACWCASAIARSRS